MRKRIGILSSNDSTRRDFIQAFGVAAGGVMLANLAGCSAGVEDNFVDSLRMPDEGEPHKRTWIAFGASGEIWGDELLPEVQRNLAAIALAIARFEPVSMLVRQEDFEKAKKLVGEKIELVVCPIDDLWIRDTGPVFVVNDKGEKSSVGLNFNGWGNKQNHDLDAKVASFVSQTASVTLKKSKLVLEGGGIEVDGRGTAIITESCVLNDNRNPGVSKTDCETELKELLGLRKIIWLPGVRGKDITDGHTDFYARFARPGAVVAGYDADPKSFDHEITKRHLEILREATDADGRRVEVAVLEAPTKAREKFASDEFAAGYINFYVCNGAVIAPKFGDEKADSAAKNTLRDLFPEREIVQINIDGIAAGGGGIHCATQQEPK